MAFPGGTPSLTPGNFPSKLLSVVLPSENAPSCGKVSNRPGQGDWEAEVRASPAQPPPAVITPSHHHVTMSHVITDRSRQRQGVGLGGLGAAEHRLLPQPLVL